MLLAWVFACNPRATLRAMTSRARAHPISAEVSWRQEFVSACAGWRLVAQHRGSATLLHASLAPDGSRLALAAADGSVALWHCGAGRWRELARAELRARGWSAAARALWAGSGARLLVAGPMALVDDWELLVLRVEGIHTYLRFLAWMPFDS